MKELSNTNFWQQQIIKAFDVGKNDDKFPKLDDYGITRENFDEYVVEKQYLLDRLSERKNKFVIPGAILILPVVIISMFTDSVYWLFVAVITGLILASTYLFIMNGRDKKHLNKLYDERIEAYIKDILEYRS